MSKHPMAASTHHCTACGLEILCPDADVEFECCGATMLSLKPSEGRDVLEPEHRRSDLGSIA